MNPYAIFIIISFSLTAIVLAFILFDMIKTGKTYGRKIPMPSKKLMNYHLKRKK